MYDCRTVQRSQKSRLPLMVTVGFRGYRWFMESNFNDFLVGDIGCLGISTRILTLRHRAQDQAAADHCIVTTTTERSPLQTEKRPENNISVLSSTA